MALKQPPYRPPPQVFGPVWTSLYGLMGYSAYRAWNTGMSSLNPNTVELTKVCCMMLIWVGSDLTIPSHSKVPLFTLSSWALTCSGCPFSSA